MTKREAVKKKPLVERVEWEQSYGKVKYLSCCHGGIPLVLDGRYGNRWNLWSNELHIDMYLRAKSEPEAKVEALLFIQKSILKMAEAWSD